MNKADPCPQSAQPSGRQAHKQVIITQCIHLKMGTCALCVCMHTYAHIYYVYIHDICQYRYIMYMQAYNAHMTRTHTHRSKRRSSYIIQERNRRKSSQRNDKSENDVLAASLQGRSHDVTLFVTSPPQGTRADLHGQESPADIMACDFPGQVTKGLTVSAWVSWVTWSEGTQACADESSRSDL